MNQKTDEIRISKTVTVVNPEGIHMRPADMLVRLASQFSSDVEVMKDGQTADAKSIMSILMLAADVGSQLEIGASGGDAEAAIEAMAQLIESGFADK